MRCDVVDTFASREHRGNPAGVVVRGNLTDTGSMQAIAHRLGLPTTAFVAAEGPGRYGVRWFTPFAELNVCGHATIAAARYLFAQPENDGFDRLSFAASGCTLTARRVGDLIAVDLPTAVLAYEPPPPGLLRALGVETAVNCAISSDDVLIELDSVAAVAGLSPDFPALARQPFRGHIVTARGADGTDFVSRTFFPALGVDEDQVCVSAHCKLAPYWADRIGRRRLSGRQLSERGGRLDVEHRGDTVRVIGSAVLRHAPRVEPVPAGAV